MCIASAVRGAARRLFALAGAVALLGCAMATDDPTLSARRRMVEEQIRWRGITQRRLLTVLEEVPRHLFVPETERGMAYADHPLPIGSGQTISQPYVVALMTSLLDLGPGDRVLEIGTGSGYQAAILAELAQAVYTMEIIEPLAVQAGERLGRLGYAKVQARLGDGYHGWPEHGPYDAILVTAAASHVPPPLIAQLKAGGRMVIPVGAPFMIQYLLLIEKAGDGSVSTRQVLPVSFVPLVGGG